MEDSPKQQEKSTQRVYALLVAAGLIAGIGVGMPIGGTITSYAYRKALAIKPNAFDVWRDAPIDYTYEGGPRLRIQFKLASDGSVQWRYKPQ